MATSAAQIRDYEGPAILSFGFRPLFFAAGAWAVIAMLVWIAMLTGKISAPGLFAPVDWHIHETLFGYLTAVMAGFLLTAVPNWTGRLPMTGMPLLVLVAVWAAGRLAVLASGTLGWALTAIVDLSFLALVMAMIAREIVAGKNWRNAKILVLVALMLVANGLFHLEASGAINPAGYGTRLGIAMAVKLISIFGGRLVPSFTRNWLARRGEGRMPAPFGRYDGVTLAAGAIALIAWTLFPQEAATALLCLAAGLLHAWRLARWAPERTFTEPLVWILHAGYLFVPLGFLLVAAAADPPGLIPAGDAVHAWTAGAIGVMTLAVMTRASLGHTGRPLAATTGVTLIYLCALTAVVLRLMAGLDAGAMPLTTLAGLAWIGAFSLFCLVIGPMLWRPKA